MIEYKSTKTGKSYESVEAALAAEKEFDNRIAKEKAEQEELKKNKEALLNEITNAIKAEKAARETVDKLIKQYRDTYGTNVAISYWDPLFWF